MVGAGSGVGAVGGGGCGGGGGQVAVSEEGAPAPQAPQQAGRQEHRGAGRSVVRGVRNDCSFFCVFCRALLLPRRVGVQIQVSFQLDALGGDLFLGLLDFFPHFLVSYFSSFFRTGGSFASALFNNEKKLLLSDSFGLSSLVVFRCHFGELSQKLSPFGGRETMQIQANQSEKRKKKQDEWVLLGDRLALAKCKRDIALPF